MNLPTIDDFRTQFERAGLAPVDLNGDGPGFAAMCSVCRRVLTIRPKPGGGFEHECESGCSFSRIADELHFKTAPAEGFATVEVVGGVTGLVEGGNSAAVVDRYAGRRVDLAALLDRPPRMIPWRVHDVVADGTLTVVSGESGSGKSWLAQALCTGVARGHAVAGLLCAKGKALYVDAEMGPEMFVDQRLRPAGVTVPEFDYIDAMGLDISKVDDLAWLHGEIEAVEAKFVVVDSLRRLTPSKSENDSDDMAPTVAALAKLARDTSAAILLVHHKGDSEKFYRGSTAIKDQADALFALLRDPEDEDAPRRLRCRGKGKMRYSLEPPDVYLTVDPAVGGVAAADAPEEPGPQVPVREAVAAAIKAALPVRYKKEAAEKIGRHDKDQTFRDAWGDLQRAGEIVQISGQWTRGSSAPRLGTATTTTSEAGVA